MSVKFKFIDEFVSEKFQGKYFDSFLLYPEQKSPYFKSFLRQIKLDVVGLPYDIDELHIFISYNEKNNVEELIIRKNLGSILVALKSKGLQTVYPEIWDVLYKIHFDGKEKKDVTW